MSKNGPIQALFQLGEIQQDSEWLDYTALGVTSDTAGDLLELIGNEQLHRADVDSDDVWVPQHAWRALGQVGDGHSIPRLLELLDDVLLSDVWAAQELPLVMGMLGSGGLAALDEFLNDIAHSEGARIIAAEAMKCVAERDSAERDAVVARLSGYLAHADNEAPELNGIVVCCLLDLKAVESIDAIREVYENGAIDISYAGDMEDIEIDLGLREKRETESSTPVRAQGGLMQKTLDDVTNGSNVDKEIEQIFELYPGENSIDSLSELDGYFTALACAPESISADQWLGAIWGGDEYMPKWKTQDEADQFVSALMVTYSRVMQALTSDTYTALFITKKEGGERIIIADEWCKGFMRGLSLWGHITTTDTFFLREVMQPIRLFATESGRKKLKAMNKGGIAYQHQKIDKSVRKIFQHWMAQRQTISLPKVIKGPKTGRNDPCPCGSGKKFKKCCLH